MEAITVLKRHDETLAWVTRTEDPAEWTLEWAGPLNRSQARFMLRNAEKQVLQNGGERLAFRAPATDDVVVTLITGWRNEELERDGDHYRLHLICPGGDGLVHEDDDDRIPLDRITCPTCVERLAEKRAESRKEAFNDKNGPKEIAVYTRRVAEAYVRLAAIEDELDLEELKSRVRTARE